MKLSNLARNSDKRLRAHKVTCFAQEIMRHDSVALCAASCATGSTSPADTGASRGAEGEAKGPGTNPEY